MAFCYDTTRISVRTDQGPMNFDPMRCNATKCYLDHYKNFLVLDFIAKNGTLHEKAQARREIEVCERKMTYWKRQPHFNADLAVTEKARLHKTV